MNRINRVAAIHDLSSFGRCSMAVIVPILSIMKTQVCALPTTILSSHTGGLLDPVVRDLPGYVAEALAHYQQLGLDFEGIYSGYLGDAQHVDDCMAFMQAYPHACKVIDPVMGDHGKPYRLVDGERINRMKELVAIADIITPNMTEVSLLLDDVYREDALSLLDYKELLVRLAKLGPKQVIITGAKVKHASMEIANLGYDRVNEAFYVIPCYYRKTSYPGTGDMFASLLLGGLLQGKSLPEGIEEATRFLEYVIGQSMLSGQDSRHGVILEPYLGWLLQPQVTYEYQLF